MTFPSICYNTNTKDDHTRLDILLKRLQKNFKLESQVLDALAATALSDERSAMHWLVNHADDPCLVSGNPREYFLLLCPVNELEARFDDFWAAYRSTRGWCAPMDCVPRAALVQPFEALSSRLLDVYHAFNTVSRFYADRCPAGDFRLALAPSDIASAELSLQLMEHSVESLLAEMAAKFAELLALVSVRVCPLRPPYRLALCDGFLQAQQPQIVRDAMEHFSIDEATRQVGCGGGSTAADTVWQLRLYSRDVRLRNDLAGETHAIYSMQAECLAEDAAYANNCLFYSAGDRVAMVAPASPRRHGWALGLNCETGQMGHFQVLGATRVPCSSVWTLHKVATIGSTVPSSPLGNSASSSCWASFSRQSSIGTDESGVSIGTSGCGGGNGGGCRHHRIIGSPGILPPSDTSGSSDSMPPSPKPVGKSKSLASFFLSERPLRQLHVMRHGERLDTTVGFNWFTKAFDHRGVFANRFDLNIPEMLPTRPAEDFNHDTPLTLIGQFVSYHIGEALAKSGVRYNYAYSSPALRCVQTAHFLLHGAGQSSLPVRIEPMLNEFPYDDCVQMPNFMTPSQLRASGYNVDAEYKPYSSLDGFDRNNTQEKYYHRLQKVFKKVLEATRKRGGAVLIVGHRTTLELCPAILMDKPCSRHLSIPYNAMLCLNEKSKKGSWSLASCPAAAFTINDHCRFDGSSVLGSSA